jgi:3-oxoacyl-[acyl-carrier protein] reductase
MGKKVLGLAGVAEPVRLDRFDGSQTSFISGNVLVGAAGQGAAVASILATLADSEACLHIPAFGAGRFELEKQVTKAKLELNHYQPEIEKDLRFKALVFDASGIENSTELGALYEFFHPVVRRLAKSARLIVIGRPPEGLEPKYATAQRALEGFTRCLGKEVGKKGANIQLVYVAKGAEAQLKAPLQFLISPKSAYVSAQVVRVTKTGLKGVEVDWRKPLADKVVLVTGASRGIGEKIAEVMARDGATVVGLDVPQAETDLNAVMSRLGGKALALDITAPEAPESISQWLKAEFGGVDVIVHNAGVTRDKTLGGMPEHFWKMAIDINLSAEERINDQLLADGMIRDNGRIVCVSSVSGLAGNFGQTNYGTSKAGVVGMVQSMSPLLNKQGITINAVAPGFIETKMTEVMPILVREVAKRINALGQPGQPQDVAEAIAFFASPAATGLSGNVIRVCGQSMLGA